MDSIAEKQATDKTPPAGNRPDTKAQIAYFEKLGFSFFALRPNDKRPAGGWDMFQHRLPSTTEKSNWIYEQRQNFAIVTGSISGNLVMVDLDPFKMDTDPQEWIQRWPTGYLVRTASNGYHLGFIAPTGVQVSNTTDKLAPGVDTRGEGGYVVAPGAKVAYYGKDAEKKGVISGYIGEYVMIGDGQPAPMPPDLLAMLVTEEPRQERPPQDYSPADADEAQTLAMLAVLPDWFDDYDSWRNICFAVFHGHGINGVSMIEGRWQCKPGEVLKMWESVEAHQEKRKANGQKIITYGSLVHAAKFYGYVPSRPDGNMSQFADLLQDATAAWDALPSISLGELLERAGRDTSHPNADQITTATPNDTKSSEAASGPFRATWGELRWSWVLPDPFRQILYTAHHAGITSATAEEWAAAANDAGLPMTARTVRNLAKKGLLVIIGDSTSTEVLCTKFTKNRRGRPELRYSLPDTATLHRLMIDNYGYSRLLETAMTEGKDTLPMYARKELLDALEIQADSRPLLSALDSIIEQLKTADREYKRKIDRVYARFRTWYSQMCADLRSSDYADDFVIDPDLQHAEGFTAANIIAAQMARHHHAAHEGEDISREDWCIAIGVSNGTLDKVLVLAGVFRKDRKPPTKLAKLEANNPIDAPAAAQRLHREIGGRPRWIHTATGGQRPYNVMNLQAAVMDDEPVYIEYSVAGTWERDTPTAQELKDAREKSNLHDASLNDSRDEETERKPRRPRHDGAGVNPYIARAWLDNLLVECGWRRDEGEYWSDTRRVLWPDHVPTLLQALTGVPVTGAIGPVSEASMLTMHYQSEKYDEPEESLPVKVQQTFAEPKPAPVVQNLHDFQPDDWFEQPAAPVFPNWEDRQPDAWVMNFNVLREPGLFDRKGA